MLKLIGAAKSRAMRSLWLLEELGIEFEHENAMPRTDEIKKLNPLGKIPILIDDGHIITDSSAIVTYLADKFEQFTYPAGTIERAKQDAHTFFLLDEFDACLWTAARHSFGLPEEHRLPEIKNSLKWEFSRSQRFFVERLGDKPFLMGEKMTVPDIIAAHCGGWAISAKFEITEPKYRNYIDRLRARPAFIRALARAN